MGHLVPRNRTCHLVLPGSFTWRFSRIRVYAAQISLLSGSRIALRTPFLAPSEGANPAAVDAPRAAMQPRPSLRGAAGVSSVIRWVRWLAMARAPGGKAGADSPSAHRDTGRLVAFSDAVFAITITLLVLEIRPPTDYSNLLHGLLALWPSYLAYGVTFLFIGQLWATHYGMLDHIGVADRVVLCWTTLLLIAA